MKKTFLMLFAALLLTLPLSACRGEQPVHTPNESTIDELQEFYVTFDAYSFVGMLSYSEVDGSGNITKSETGSLLMTGFPGQTVSDMLAHAQITQLDAVCEGDVFEGWMVYKETVTTDEDGFDIYSYERISGDTLYTTQELLEQNIPEYDITYVAKWQSVSDQEYREMYKGLSGPSDDEDTSGNYFLSLYANGGVIFTGDEAPYEDIVLGGFALTAGESMGDMIGAPIHAVEKEGATFTGWTIYTAASYEVLAEEPTDLAENEFCLSLGSFGFQLLQDYQIYSELASTEELTGIICENMHYFAIPNWA